MSSSTTTQTTTTMISKIDIFTLLKINYYKVFDQRPSLGKLTDTQFNEKIEGIYNQMEQVHNLLSSFEKNNFLLPIKYGNLYEYGLPIEAVKENKRYKKHIGKQQVE